MSDAASAGFPSMRIPVSSNRTGPANWIAGVDPSQPESWCSYLQAVRSFWERQGWLGSLPFLYAQDEPDANGQRLVARQAKALHACWPGAKALMTGNPSPTGENAFLSDGKGGDDLDIWAVLSRRYYGEFTVGSQTSRARVLAATIERIRRNATVWSYTYSGVAGTPGFAATEPLSAPRSFLLWNALEGLQGVLYGQGTTSYDDGNPFTSVGRNGEYVLLYPGPGRPVPSARLEQIRDGIEDWALYDAIRRRSGSAAVRAILGGTGLFSADRRGVRLACHIGCELKSADEVLLAAVVARREHRRPDRSGASRGAPARRLTVATDNGRAGRPPREGYAFGLGFVGGSGLTAGTEARISSRTCVVYRPLSDRFDRSNPK